MEPPKTNKSCFIQMVYGIVVLQILVCAFMFFIPFGGSKEDSKRATCISQVRQITLGSILYAGDNNEVFPANFTFDGQANERKFMTNIKPYLSRNDDSWKGVFRCRFDTATYEPGHQYDPKPSIPVDMTYVHCNSLKNVIPNFASGKRILKESSAPEPAKASYLRDPIRGSKDGITQSLHGENQGFNISFLDGHVKRKKENNLADL
jgi:prepilin-type processing-associated H-X9-DG protein